MALFELRLSPIVERLLIDFVERIPVAIIGMERRIMAKVDDVMAAVEKNTEIVESLDAAVDILNGEHNSIEEAIKDLKAQIESGAQPDFTGVDAALEAQSSALQRLKDSVIKNTDLDPTA